MKIIKSLGTFLADWFCYNFHTEGYSYLNTFVCEECHRVWGKETCISRKREVDYEELASYDLTSEYQGPF